MTDFAWQGDGPVFTLEADGRTWTLDLASRHPGLAWSDGRWNARLLRLDHIAAAGQRDESAFDASSLVAFERHRGRIQAIFAPRSWSGLNVRAAWGPTPDRDGFDLEVQVWTTASGVFRRLEVAVISSWSDAAGNAANPRRYTVLPRDVHAAALSYDGREPADVLHSLSTRPIPASSPHELEPIGHPLPGPSPAAAGSYLEMVRPNDCARRIAGVCRTGGDPPLRGRWTRYGLFGYDLEKGVVLRGRVRGVWLAGARDEEERRRRLEAFLAEPPSLGP